MANRAARPAAALLLLAARAAADLEIWGVTNGDSSVNGHYKRYPRGDNGRPCYKQDRSGIQDSGNVYVVYMKEYGYWAVQPETHFRTGSHQVTIHSADTKAVYPFEAEGKWQVWSSNTEAGEWVPADLQVIRHVPYYSHRVDRALAFASSAVFVMAVVGAAALSSSHHVARTLGTRYASRVIAVVIVWGTLKLFNWWFIEGILHAWGVDRQLKEGFELIFQFFLFTLCYFMLSFLGWKCQYHPRNLLAIQLLGAYCLAYTGTKAFALIMAYSVDHVGPLLQNPDMFQHLNDAKMCTSILTLLVVWIVFELYMMASQGARAERFYWPPQFPWGERMVAQAFGRACQSMSYFGVGGSTHPSDEFLKDEQWTKSVDTAENNGMSIIVGCLVLHVLDYMEVLYREESRTISEMTTEARQDLISQQMSFYGGKIVVFLVAFFILAFLRNTCYACGRFGTQLQRSVAMAIAYCCEKEISLLVQKDPRVGIMDPSMPASMATTSWRLAHVLTAFGVWVVSVFILWLLDRMLEQVATKELSVRGFGVHVEVTLEGRHAVTIAVAFLSGSAWTAVMSLYVAFVAREYSPTWLADHTKLAETVITLLLVLGLWVPWYRSLLPKSLLEPEHHAKLIAHEKQMLLGWSVP
mmetsp:Transcript_45232/g.137146  ORF Transcript_45232/g.137146 Transcript_45232/m.137146 type:complete len:638 (-) Transcript_45232:162-2075(-)